MTEPTTGNPPLISATKLAARWGKHPSTITRMARDGVINPVAKAGSQMTFSMSDVLRVEAGIFPKLRELPNILSLLGLELAELTPTERVAQTQTGTTLARDPRSMCPSPRGVSF